MCEYGLLRLLGPTWGWVVILQYAEKVPSCAGTKMQQTANCTDTPAYNKEDFGAWGASRSWSASTVLLSASLLACSLILRCALARSLAHFSGSLLSAV
jgi:hypothetical protein